MFLHVGNIPAYDLYLLLHEYHYYALTSLSAWFGKSYYCVEGYKAFNNKNRHTCKSDYTCNMCNENTCLYKPSYTRFCKEYIGIYRISTYFNNHEHNGVCACAKSCEKCAYWFSKPVSTHICESLYCTYSKYKAIRNQKCFVEVEKKTEINFWRYVFYDFECMQNTLDAETDRPVHNVLDKRNERA